MRKHLIVLFTIITIVVIGQSNKTIYIKPMGQVSIEIDVLAKNYYIQRLGTSEGETLFNRTMRYCSTTEGWTLNKDAAKLFGITTQ